MLLENETRPAQPMGQVPPGRGKNSGFGPRGLFSEHKLLYAEDKARTLDRGPMMARELLAICQCVDENDST